MRVERIVAPALRVDRIAGTPERGVGDSAYNVDGGYTMTLRSQIRRNAGSKHELPCPCYANAGNKRRITKIAIHVPTSSPNCVPAYAKPREVHLSTHTWIKGFVLSISFRFPHTHTVCRSQKRFHPSELHKKEQVLPHDSHLICHGRRGADTSGIHGAIGLHVFIAANVRQSIGSAERRERVDIYPVVTSAYFSRRYARTREVALFPGCLLIVCGQIRINTAIALPRDVPRNRSLG